MPTPQMRTPRLQAARGVDEGHENGWNGATDSLGCAAAILACGGGLRVFERDMHRPVSGRRIREFAPSGESTLRLHLRPRKPGR